MHRKTEPVFYSEKQLDAMGIMSRPQRHRLRKMNKFPQPVRLSENRIGYPKAAIDRWIAERMEGYDDAL